jgi:DNA (cytosine-5)-methyltransferase 1
MRLVAELRPTWVIGENVAGHISMGLDDVLSDLENAGYACRSFIIPACAVGASHRRDRVWTLGYACGLGSTCKFKGCSRVARDGMVSGGRDKKANITCGPSEYMADAISIGQQGQGQPIQRGHPAAQEKWQANYAIAECQRKERGAESRMGRMADGFSCRLDEPRERVKAGVKNRAARLQTLGNAVHPDIPMMLGAAILEAEAGQ